MPRLRAVLLALGAAVLLVAPARGEVLLPPQEGLYLSGHPDCGLRDETVTSKGVRDFVALTGRPLVWSYLSWHWDGRFPFPAEACRVLHREGVVPLVGILPWSTGEQNRPEPRVTLKALLAGRYDRPLRAAARQVRGLGFPVMLCFGPEADGGWFPWSGRFNGGSRRDGYGSPDLPDGPERFRDAFRRVVRLFREEGAVDVTWVFHAAERPGPDLPWNGTQGYYPGDGFADWIGVSLYGWLRSGPVREMGDLLAGALPRLEALSSRRPLAVLEWGIAAGPGVDKGGWIRNAFEAFTSGEHPRLRAVAWWDKARRPDGTPSGLALEESPEGVRAYREGAASRAFGSPARFGPRRD
ncbi:conserved hypothetical protein [Aminomonas paucivorans DSM 12260]|uniref:GH26 domain-containing protein n=1 Tax=Aminomonas paucivorans DSM 12260 TaxID=584708 RepID=E3CWW7_9BACT|nr:beta-mannanase [Aminomonas paucivorans]EFQ23417.1 conserved hypothetical protein [Aminomonas paucivorans DSM 12260]